MTLRADPAAERRPSRRRPSNRSARVECRAGNLGFGPNLALRLVNLSETGVCLLVRHHQPKDTKVEVLLSGVGSSKPLRREGTVVYAQQHDDATSTLGIKLDKPLSYKDLQHLS